MVRDELKSEVWTCPIGHPVCGECIDVDNVGEDTDTDSGQESQSQSQSSSGSGESGADDESTESVDVDNGQTDSCKSDSLVVSSYVRYLSNLQFHFLDILVFLVIGHELTALTFLQIPWI